MGKYIKLFENHNGYTAYTADTENFLLPNVSYCVEQDEVHYNPFCSPSDEYVVFDVTANNVGASETSNTITWQWSRTAITSACAETITNGNESTSVTFSVNSSVDSRTVSGIIEWNGNEIEYSFIQNGVYAIVVNYDITTTAKSTKIASSITADTKELWIDGEKKNSISTGYTFSTTGEHNAVFFLKDNVNSVNANAFRGCSALTNVYLPDGITGIGNSSFRECGKMESIDMPNSVTTISPSAFTYCSGLTSIELPSGITFIGNAVFDCCSALTSISIPSGVTGFGKYAFSNCRGLTSFTIPSGVTAIGAYAFNYCTGLTSIVIPSGVTRLNDYTFYHCHSLASVTLLDGLNYLGSSVSEGYVFGNCSGLTSITIPSTLIELSNNIFKNCTALSVVTCLAITPPSSGGYNFDNNASGRKIYVPLESVNAYKTAINWGAYASDIEPITN